MNQSAKDLLTWYDHNRRLLPWREQVNIYHTWVCEVMSQQTTLAVVVPKFTAFIKHLPTVNELAACDEEILRQLWSGLGYYARARNLKKGAQYIVGQLNGCFPQSYQQWLKIPGCGSYTAAVIASICFHEKVACVDGNIVRVVSRLLALNDVWSSSGKAAIHAYVSSIIPDQRPGDFNQAMMELGATICRKTNPLCYQCPLQQNCLAFAKNCIHICPPKKPRRQSVHTELFALLIWRKVTDTLALVNRNKGFLSNTLGFPLITQVEVLKAKKVLESLQQFQFIELPSEFSHTITHYRISGKIFVVQEMENSEYTVDAISWQELNLSQPFYWIEKSLITAKLSTTLDYKVFQLFEKYQEKISLKL